MTQQSYAALTAALVAALVAAVVPGLVSLIRGVELPKVSITVALIQTQGGCQVLTVPASPEVLPGQEVEWTVSGSCTVIDPANIEVKFGVKTGDACSGENPMDSGQLKGKKIKKKVKTGATTNRHCYGIYNGNDRLEDPDLDIRRK